MCDHVFAAFVQDDESQGSRQPCKHESEWENPSALNLDYRQEGNAIVNSKGL